MKNKMNNSVGFKWLVLCLLIPFAACKSSEKTTISLEQIPQEDLVSYAEIIQPIIQNSCSPCHFPEEGRERKFDSYDAVKGSIKGILYRVQLSPDEIKFMPYKSKKAPLSQEEIQHLKVWMAQGMPE